MDLVSNSQMVLIFSYIKIRNYQKVNSIIILTKTNQIINLRLNQWAFMIIKINYLLDYVIFKIIVLKKEISNPNKRLLMKILPLEHKIN